MGVSNQSAATALGRLTAARWVKSAKATDGDKRASWYDIAEPLLRYHLHYRDDRSRPTLERFLAEIGAVTAESAPEP